MREAPDERFVRLEEKAAYLEKLALDLNEVVIRQAQELDELLARVERLERQQRSAQDDESIPHEKPPHY
jgi:uncharacterized coiled-coil protein SlyX